MKNQDTKITGLLDLTDQQADLIKRGEKLVDDVSRYLAEIPEVATDFDPECLNIASSHLNKGFIYLGRSIIAKSQQF